VFHKGRSS
jgi:hypothetical protein